MTCEEFIGRVKLRSLGESNFIPGESSSRRNDRNSFKLSWQGTRLQILVSVASVSVGSSTRSRHFSLFGGAKIGASATPMNFFVLAPIFARPRSEKCFKPEESPTKTLATQASKSGCHRCESWSDHQPGTSEIIQAVLRILSQFRLLHH